MLGIENFPFFIVASLIFVLTPGIDTVFVLNKSISQGKRAGIYASIGINSGILFHTVFAALGLSMIVAKSAVAFSTIKYIGAAYLVYLGIKAIFSKESKLNFNHNAGQDISDWKNFKIGFITNVLNPKVALFFLSFFPQFISKEYIGTPLPFIILGITHAVFGLIWFLLLSYFSAMFSYKLKENPKFNYFLNKFSGIVYILLGVKVALTKK